MIKINKVGIENFELLRKLDLNNFEDPWTEEMLKQELELPQSEYYGLFNDDDLLGFCGGWYIADEYQINKIVIDKQHQNKKLGQMFLVYIMELYRIKGAKQSVIEVRESNIRAIKAYTKAGFDFIGKRENYYTNNGENAYVMIRKLN